MVYAVEDIGGGRHVAVFEQDMTESCRLSLRDPNVDAHTGEHAIVMAFQLIGAGYEGALKMNRPKGSPPDITQVSYEFQKKLQVGKEAIFRDTASEGSSKYESNVISSQRKQLMEGKISFGELGTSTAKIMSDPHYQNQFVLGEEFEYKKEPVPDYELFARGLGLSADRKTIVHPIMVAGLCTGNIADYLIEEGIVTKTESGLVAADPEKVLVFGNHAVRLYREIESLGHGDTITSYSKARKASFEATTEEGDDSLLMRVQTQQIGPDQRHLCDITSMLLLVPKSKIQED
ncbi:MAG: hypothetical protein ABIE94_00470 [archaeon]